MIVGHNQTAHDYRLSMIVAHSVHGTVIYVFQVESPPLTIPDATQVPGGEKKAFSD